MTTGRINQIAIPTDRSASEKRSSQPRPTDAAPELSSGLEPPSRRFLSIAECACDSSSKRESRRATRTAATRRTAPTNGRTGGARVSKGQPSQSTMRHDKRKGPNRVRAHRSRDTGARRSCARSTPDQSPRPHPGLSDRRLRCTLGRRDRVRPFV